MANGKRNSEVGSRRDSNGGKPAKRSRVSRACDPCRASRERCDGEQKCQTCIFQNRTCTYNAQPKKRGIQPNYIRTLELTLAWLLQTFPEAESRLADSIPQEDQDVTKLLRGKDSEAAEALHLAWRNSLICKQIDQLLSGDTIDTHGNRLAEPGVSEQDQSSLEFASFSTPHRAGTLEQNALQPDRTGRGLESGLLHSAEPLQFAPPGLSSQHAPITLPDNALMLLEYYFAFTHSWLPMTEKSSLLKLMYSYPSGGLPGDQLLGAEHAELWSVMALAATQLSDETNIEESRRIRKIAEALIPSVEGNASFKVPHIRSIILLALIDASEGSMLAAWLRIGTVVSLLLLFRILEQLNLTEKWCRHIHLAAFVVESAIASHLHVPRHLRSSYAETLGLVDEDGIDEWAPWLDPLDTQNQPAKAPARSFSTLNSLLRRALPLSDEGAPNASANHDGNADSSIVFALLNNASHKNKRIQPSVLVGKYDSSPSGLGLGTQSFRHRSSSVNEAVNVSPILQNLNWKQQQQAASPNDMEIRQSFMSIPNDMNTFPGVHQDLGTADIWTSSPSVLRQPDLDSVFAENSTTGTDIFEQFDALLERQDSTQQAQFYQNLGFAPDVELAEFFGSDFVPSDPLLAYLNPTLYGINQGNGVIPREPDPFRAGHPAKCPSEWLSADSAFNALNCQAYARQEKLQDLAPSVDTFFDAHSTPEHLLRTMPDLHSLPEGWRPETACRNNGPDGLALERWKLRELAEGWPMYRDSCEWENFASILAPNAYVYTTWTGKIFWSDFFKMSKDGMDKGAFIMHRCSGVTTDINTDATRAMTKMKATITQRFEIDGCEVDAESDCRFAYFWEKGTDTVKDLPLGEWRARYVRHWYEKDWLRPVNPNKIPKLDEAKLATYPNGYRYLSYCQEASIPGLKVLMDLPGHRRDADNLNGKAHDALYLKCKTWVEGGTIDF